MVKKGNSRITITLPAPLINILKRKEISPSKYILQLLKNNLTITAGDWYEIFGDYWWDEPEEEQQENNKIIWGDNL